MQFRISAARARRTKKLANSGSRSRAPTAARGGALQKSSPLLDPALRKQREASMRCPSRCPLPLDDPRAIFSASRSVPDRSARAPYSPPPRALRTSRHPRLTNADRLPRPSHQPIRTPFFMRGGICGFAAQHSRQHAIASSFGQAFQHTPSALIVSGVLRCERGGGGSGARLVSSPRRRARASARATAFFSARGDRPAMQFDRFVFALVRRQVAIIGRGAKQFRVSSSARRSALGSSMRPDRAADCRVDQISTRTHPAARGAEYRARPRGAVLPQRRGGIGGRLP